MKIKSILLLTATAFLLTACKHKASNAPGSEAKPANRDNLELALDHDPVCDMKVDQNVEDTLLYKGKIYGFCNPGCKEKFREDPEKYIGQ